EGDHDAPRGSEQAHIGAGRTDRGQQLEVLLQAVHLADHRRAHGVLCTFHHGTRIRELALALAREFAEARLEDAGHADRFASLGDFLEERGHLRAGPEALLELVTLVEGTVEYRPLPEDDIPGRDRRGQQQGHDDLDRDTGPQDQFHQVQFIAHAVRLSSRASGIGVGRKPGTRTQATRTWAVLSSAPSLARTMRCSTLMLAPRSWRTNSCTSSRSS